MSETRVTVTRIRMVGRRWKADFLEDLMELLKITFGGETLIRLNSFLTPQRRFPITDFDVFKEVDDETIRKLRDEIEKLLEEHGYNPRRLLAIKKVETTITARESAIESRREDVGTAEERAEAETT
ncbi:hypothetical protein Pyrfu_1935 [Pyrolobus fumarii 1A]|uniref:Uncharacterized protein n=1 Tax=Pyrolobus fumarii (strain DSM 11204 / 1A) TaxID=694429 RepID=G0EDB0_PYRF1|nr:hypothetical protein [Pyrolobus fumarii]AEM39788.1 hypothetical protein Pyrfu_1935 [Pyrolobus fumarii 1A]